ncbi:MAG TPA: tetratricopeptide repeat protein, partial [Phnomibacter sp.]|nr:tetratricopeptide repeat protein [Phnomibacter sp.]
LHAPCTNNVNCITCHMPSKVYMGNDLRHDHSFRIPRPDLTDKYGTPNTCNSCHSNKTAKWAAEKIAAQFGEKRRYHFAEDLVPGSQLDAQSENHLSKLLADTAIPDIVRAATLRYFSLLGSNNAGQVMAQHTRDSNALVRRTALSGLLNYAPSVWMDAASKALEDPALGVRIAAANLMTSLPSSQIPSNYFAAFSRAKTELDQFIIFQTDFAQGNLQAGDYYQRQNDLLTAEKFYRRAIAKDSQLVVARTNLAATMNATGRNKEALQQLQAASNIDPRNDHIWYSLGLLYAEMKDFAAAEKALAQCIALNKNNIRAQYNYGLLLQQQGKTAAAASVFSKALQVDPHNGDVLNALVILYAQQGQTEKALQYARVLKQYHGSNPAYANLLSQMGL